MCPLKSQRTRSLPPALKKYLACASLPQAHVPRCSIVPVSVVVVLQLDSTIESLPCTFNLLDVIVLIFPDQAAYALIVSPALGLLILVILEP